MEKFSKLLDKLCKMVYNVYTEKDKQHYITIIIRRKGYA